MFEKRAQTNASEIGTRARERTRGDAKRPRSAVTSGRKLFVEGDPNSAWSRRYHDLVVSHVSDLGGPDLLSAARMSLIRRVSAIEVELEQMDGQLSMGQPVDLDKYTRAAGHLRRLFETLGLDRVARDVSTADTFPLEQEFDDVAEVSDDQPTREARALAAYLRLIKGDNTRT